MEPIRVLHILHSMNRGGAENAIMNYYRHVNRDKVQFDFLLTEPHKCQFEEEIVYLGGKIYRVPLLTIKNPFPYMRAVRNFFQHHPEYQIVHSHTSSKSFFPLYIAKSVGIPIRICHSHNTQSESGFRGLIRDFFKGPLKKVSTNYFACGEEAAIWLYGQHAIDSKAVTIIPNVIECDKYDYNENIRHQIRSSLSISSLDIILGSVARFSYQKNHLFLIDLFREFHKLQGNSKLLLIGDGELHDSIVEKVHDYHLDDSVIMTGVVSNVNDFEQAMDFFIMPSFFEGLPLSLIEAQISGLKCFVSDEIPKEADKTGLVTFLPLKKGPELWAKCIKNSLGYIRESKIQDIRRSGYDAVEAASKLEFLYIELFNKQHVNKLSP